ncbi:MAG: cyclic nucleotide-binding domain-containing protein [Candidatus Goldbacteria bacterium]|nr:cyclic nucleotide-binding domain-containing protein [Candidatus Goldiibacteriota bacterium]
MEQNEYEQIKALPFFKNLLDQEMDVILKKIFTKFYKKGSILFVEGMPGEVLYIVMEGSIVISKKIKEGKEIEIAKLGYGEIVGEMSLIDAGPRTATGKTEVDSKLVVITKKSFNEILESDPQIAAKILMELLRVLNKRLRVTDKKFENT